MLDNCLNLIVNSAQERLLNVIIIENKGDLVDVVVLASISIILEATRAKELVNLVS